MSEELLLVKASANYDPHTIKFFDDESKEVGKLAMKDGVLTFTGNADGAAKMFVQHVCDRTFQLTLRIKELEQEKVELLGALREITEVNEVNPVLVYQEMERIARSAITKAKRVET